MCSGANSNWQVDHGCIIRSPYVFSGPGGELPSFIGFVPRPFRDPIGGPSPPLRLVAGVSKRLLP